MDLKWNWEDNCNQSICNLFVTERDFGLHKPEKRRLGKYRKMSDLLSKHCSNYKNNPINLRQIVKVNFKYKRCYVYNNFTIFLQQIMGG